MSSRDVRWHHRLLPETDAERLLAAEEFVSRTGYAFSPKEALELLVPWLDRGWPLKAILMGLDVTYKGERQQYLKKKSERENFERRMAAWIDGFGNRRPTPVEAVDREALAAQQRQRWHDEVGHSRPATSRSDDARRQVRAVADDAYTRARGDRVEHVRESNRRLRRAMDLLGPGPRLVEPEEVFAAERDTRGALYTEITHRAAMRTSGLDDAAAQTLAAPQGSPSRQVLSNQYRRYRLAQAYSQLDELIDPPE